MTTSGNGSIGTDLEVASLALGGNVFGWTADEQTSFGILDAFTAGGGNLIDTSDSYMASAPGNHGGESETIIGSWLARSGRRDDVVIATKVSRHPDFRGLAPQTVARAARASLQRLGTDRIDLYFAHYDDDAVPLADTLAAFDTLVAEGLVRYYGLSNYSPERIEEAFAVARTNGLRLPVSLQPLYSLVERKAFETGYAPLAEREKLSVFPYFTLASGFLTGKYDRNTDVSGRARGGMVQKYFTEKGFHILDVLREVASAHSVRPSSVALAWLNARPAVTAPIASASRLEQVPDLLAALTLELTEAEIEALAEASA